MSPSKVWPASLADGGAWLDGADADEGAFAEMAHEDEVATIKSPARKVDTTD